MSLTPEQLEMRRTGIGGSEIAALLGESRFASEFDVWLAKTQGWHIEESEDMKRGTFLEDGIARWYADRFGIEPWRVQQPGTIRHKSVPVALCTPDRLIVGPETDRLLSIKAPRRKTDAWGEPGTDIVPGEYLLQLQWEHAVYGYAGVEMHLAALLDGELCVYVVQADLELQKWLLDYAQQWWARHVVGGKQPSLDGSAQAKAWLKSRFPKDDESERDAAPSEISLMVQLELAESDLTAADQHFDDLANQLRQSMGSTARLNGPNGYVTWKTDKRSNKAFRTKWTNKEK